MRLIDEKGNQLGTLDTKEALKLAQGKGLDLVEVAPIANPPVAKILDYGKYQYRMSKQERLHSAQQRKSLTKGVRISFRISQHDFETKVKQVEKFISKGHRVKIELRLKGREKGLVEFAKEKLQNFLETIKTEYDITEQPKRQNFGITVIIAPKK